jgi:hypothetical protein
MYVDSSPVTARRSARRGACSKPARQTASAPARHPRPEMAAARRSRLDDAIVAQWLLDQLPSEHRHAFSSATHR